MFIAGVYSVNYQICRNRVNFENSSSNLFGHLNRKESTGQTFHFPSWIIPVSIIRGFRKFNIVNFIIDKAKMINFSIYIIYLRRVFKMMLTTLSESGIVQVYWPIKKVVRTNVRKFLLCSRFFCFGSKKCQKNDRCRKYTKMPEKKIGIFKC